MVNSHIEIDIVRVHEGRFIQDYMAYIPEDEMSHLNTEPFISGCYFYLYIYIKFI